MIHTVGGSLAFLNAEVEYRREQLASQWGTAPARGRRTAATRFRLPRAGSRPGSHRLLPIVERGGSL